MRSLPICLFLAAVLADVNFGDCLETDVKYLKFPLRPENECPLIEDVVDSFDELSSDGSKSVTINANNDLVITYQLDDIVVIGNKVLDDSSQRCDELLIIVPDCYVYRFFIR